MARGGGTGQFSVTGGEWGWGKQPRCMPGVGTLILGDGEGENSPKNTLHGSGWAAGEARRRSTGGAVEGCVCRAKEKQCAGVKHIDVELGPYGGWSKLSAMGRPWRAKRMASVSFEHSSWRNGSIHGCSFVRRRFLAHEGGLAAQGGSSLGTVAVEQCREWKQAEREQGRDNDGARCDRSGFSFAAKCGADKAGQWRRT
jgi:hypothetical protein